jgi:hypothetical protein
MLPSVEQPGFLTTDKYLSVELKKLEMLLTDFGKNVNTIMNLVDNIESSEISKYKNNDQNQLLLHQFLINTFSASSESGVVDEDYFLDIFSKLVKRGCNINHVDSNNWSLLHYSCVFNLPKTTDYILENSAFEKSRLVDAIST